MFIYKKCIRDANKWIFFTSLYLFTVNNRECDNVHLGGLILWQAKYQTKLQILSIFSTKKKKMTSLMYRHWYRHTPRSNPKVQYAFKISMTHWILQFALRIAVRSVLHRCASLDIHCWKLWNFKSKNFHFCR